MASDGIVIQERGLLSAEAQALIAALDAELTRVYPEEGANHFRLDPDEVADGRGAFLVALQRGTPIGCGAVRRIDDRTGELKRMYVAPEARGTGVGRAMLAALEEHARSLGLVRVVLETGARQERAMRLYARAGFVRIAPFGEYVSSPLSVCMAKDL
jgi:GNAT superfamily N-acetyltransferase